MRVSPIELTTSRVSNEVYNRITVSMSNEMPTPPTHTPEQQARSYLRVPAPSPNIYARECATEWSR